MNRDWFENGPLRFAVGVEDAFIAQTRPGERRLDEYELTQHNIFWHSDLALARDVGAEMVRWGIPWYRVNPEEGKWEWSWLDRVVDRFVELGLEPIVDLMHYGTPLWLDNQFANHDYPARIAEYGYRVAERYRGRLNVFTPLNEPLVNIAFCGEHAYWPPYLSGSDGFVKLLGQIAKGIVLTQSAIANVNPEASFVHVEASFQYGGDVAGEHTELVEHLRHRAYLVEDLLTGGVDAAHPLLPFLTHHGFTDDQLEWHSSHHADPDVMGINYYPLFSTERLEEGVRHRGGMVDPRPGINAWTDGLENVLRAWAERYGRPVFLTETSVDGPEADRVKWLEASVAAIRSMRASGLDVVGFTWWCLIDMVEWTYRHGSEPPENYLLRMGLWDLVPDGAGVLQRQRNAVAERFQELAADERAEAANRRTTETVE